ncbi:rhomboid family intramembrane serine protease [Glacieibacterium frigidum]|uniref:Rhomboid family intramembrane serine protease n=1 Tax=Glacieibacterium frigidum TaxID=2593303 RepID=A0A552UHJ8_9SPHN|nr:rhomboid family intramembrane serine protease [Glacieibacterium frigidum]TRW17695.1 rhomboid family intramembrane serine protease [Glacieibacterium frigidum]
MKPFKPPVAVATRTIVGLNIAVQVVLTLIGAKAASAVSFAGALIPMRLVQNIDGPVPAVLTLFTSIFLHAGWLHLALNLVFLAWVGKYVEWVVGRWRFVALYLGGGLAGGLLQVAADPQSIIEVVGASGAIAAVFGCYAVLFARSRASGKRILGIDVSSEAVTALWFAAVWIGLQLATGYVFGGMGQGVAIWAHVGGFITGLIFAQPFVRETPKL